MISERRTGEAVEVMVELGLVSGEDVGVVVGAAPGSGVLPGMIETDWVAAGAVVKWPHAARKRPPASAPSPMAARRRNSLRVREGIFSFSRWAVQLSVHGAVGK